MTAIDFSPVNKNFLSPLGFKFLIKKLPNTSFFVQKANIPGIQIAAQPVQPNPFTKIPYAGDHIEYNEFQLTFRVDEDLQNYMEIHNWISGLGFPENLDEFNKMAQQKPGTGLGLKSDATLIITTNGKSPNYECIFEDAFPVSLSDLNFDTTDESVEYIEATATFYYTLYKISGL